MNIYIVGLPGMPYMKRAADIRLVSYSEIYSAIGHNTIMASLLSVPADDEVKLAENVKTKTILCKRPKNGLMRGLALALALYGSR